MAARVGERKRSALVILVAIAVVVVALVAWRLIERAAPGASQTPVAARPSASAPTSSAPAVATAPAPSAASRWLEFAAGADRLPAGSSETLAAVADAARADSSASVEITGHYADGDDPELALRRARVVRHALEANGVAPAQMHTGTAKSASSGTAPAETRVEVRLR